MLGGRWQNLCKLKRKLGVFNVSKCVQGDTKQNGLAHTLPMDADILVNN